MVLMQNSDAPEPRRLLAEAVGERLCGRLGWAELSAPEGVSTRDRVAALISSKKPAVVLALGKPAVQAVEDARQFYDGLLPEFRLVAGPYPTGRTVKVLHRDTLAELVALGV
jgi:hypothetical protein